MILWSMRWSSGQNYSTAIRRVSAIPRRASARDSAFKSWPIAPIVRPSTYEAVLLSAVALSLGSYRPVSLVPESLAVSKPESYGACSKHVSIERNLLFKANARPGISTRELCI